MKIPLAMATLSLLNRRQTCSQYPRALTACTPSPSSPPLSSATSAARPAAEENFASVLQVAMDRSKHSGVPPYLVTA